MDYPPILKRVQSTFADQIVAFILVGLFITLANQIDEESVPLKVLAIFIGMSYEPLFTYFSRTLGQRLTGIKVAIDIEKFSFNLMAFYIRFFTKMLVGWISLVIVFTNAKRKAIHDNLSGTIVLYK